MSISRLILRCVAILAVCGSVVMLAPAGDPPVEADVWKEREPIALKGWLAGSLDFSPNAKILLVGGTEGHSATFHANTGTLKNSRKTTDGFVALAYGASDDVIVATTAKTVTHVQRSVDGNTSAIANQVGFQQWAVATLPSDIEQKNDGLYVTSRYIYGNPWCYQLSIYSTIQTSMSTKMNGNHSISISVNRTKGQSIDPYAVPLAVSPVHHSLVTQGKMDMRTEQYSVMVVLFRGTTVYELKGHPAIVVCAAWSRDGNTIVTGDDEGTIIVWDAKTFKESKRFSFGKDRICSVDVSADGKRIVAATIQDAKPNYTENIYVWDVANPPKAMKPIAPPKGSGGPFHGVASVKFTPDGKTLAACFCNFDHLDKLGVIVGHVRIWDLQPRH